MTLPIALRLALRELRGGLAGFRIFLACLALGVAAIAAVGSVRMAIEEGLSREAASILGGDAQIEFTYRFADQAERDWMAEKATEISGLVDFRSMAAFADGSGETQRALVQVKAVDGAYPLYGRVELAGGGSLAAALATRDGLPGLVAQRILIDRFGLERGDVLRLGTQDFRLSDELLVEPDAAASGFGLGPRVIVLLKDLADSGLLTEGSLFDSSYRLRLPPDRDDHRGSLAGRHARAPRRVRGGACRSGPASRRRLPGELEPRTGRRDRAAPACVTRAARRHLLPERPDGARRARRGEGDGAERARGSLRRRP